MQPQAVPPKPEPPSEDQVAEIREIFTLFDKDCDGFVSVEELGTMLRALNHNPTDAEVDTLKKEIAQGAEKFDQNAFIVAVMKRGKDTETMDDLVEALGVLAGEGEKPSTIRAEKFKYYMVNKGEQIPAGDFNELMADLDIIHEDCINIEELAKILLTK